MRNMLLLGQLGSVWIGSGGEKYSGGNMLAIYIRNELIVYHTYHWAFGESF